MTLIIRFSNVIVYEWRCNGVRCRFFVSLNVLCGCCFFCSFFLLYFSEPKKIETKPSIATITTLQFKTIFSFTHQWKEEKKKHFIFR